jgi:hypothetical protein
MNHSIDSAIRRLRNALQRVEAGPGGANFGMLCHFTIDFRHSICFQRSGRRYEKRCVHRLVAHFNY